MTIAAATVGRSETGKYFVLADAALPSPEFPTGNGKVDLQVTVVMLSWV